MNDKLKQITPPPSDAQFHLIKIDSVNHKPHPYTIGPRHVAHASTNFNGMLTQQCIEDGERTRRIFCAHPGCGLSYHLHTSDTVLFIGVTMNTKDLNAVPGLGNYLVSIKDEATKLGIDGFAFVDKSKEKAK